MNSEIHQELIRNDRENGQKSELNILFLPLIEFTSNWTHRKGWYHLSEWNSKSVKS